MPYSNKRISYIPTVRLRKQLDKMKIYYKIESDRQMVDFLIMMVYYVAEIDKCKKP